MKPPKASKPKRLVPKPDVLRELFLLSGNNCAMPDCKNVIVDRAGVGVGHICHIEAALPDGARFNENQNNEQRRALSNLVLMCAGHHAQIDSKKHATTWTVKELVTIKANHEKKFKGLDGSLQQAFEHSYVDSTDALAPTFASSFAALDILLPNSKVRPSEEPKRKSEIKTFVSKMSKIPDDERGFMAGVIRRATKLDPTAETVCVHVDDIRSSLGISQNRLQKLGAALERYDVGRIDLASVGDADEPHVMLSNPSSYIFWTDIVDFCEASGRELDDFVMRLKFEFLDQQ
ncbi:hypothetical protein GOZ94_24760 [Agrobacterium vitis]|uniref:hypothetical protein n=1 Tax=Agrobacterium vitis TaxID=373 RepID=UPI0012E929CD|nr:hypothetical protein [Agrobacterium vitis]MVA22148.1 hypothetical protein [Agrobacterium vitis]